MENKLPKDWKLVKLKDICEVVTGTTPPKSDMSNYGKEVPFFKPPHLWDGLISETEEMLSVKGAEKARVVPPNTVLVTCIGNLGRTGFVKKNAAFNQQINAILENDKIDGKYIFYQAQSPTFRNQLEKLATGTTVSIVNKGNFETINIPLAPLETQQSIVSKIEELFSELDQGIEDLKTAQQQLKTYRQSVLKWAFEGKLTNENVKEGELPKGWEMVNMSNVIEKPKYGTSKKCDYAIKGIGVLRIPNIAKGIVDSTDLKFAKFDEKEIDTYSLKEGDILTIRSNGSVDLVGKCALISKKDEGCLYAGYLIRLRPILNKVNPKYLIYILTSIDLRNQIEEKAKSTSGVNNINSEELSTLKIQLPPIEEQQHIVQEIESRISVADKMEESIAQSLQQAEALRQSILKKAFSGELV
jgi:type I restriction enzyme S subunit